METMTGLERVVIYGCVPWETENEKMWTRYEENKMSACIRHCAGNPEITVVFEYDFM